MSAVFALFATGAAAQSVNDYHLPSAPTANPRAQGPVTPDNPVVLSPRPTPSATVAAPPPAPLPAPTSPTVTRTASPAPRPAASPIPRQPAPQVRASAVPPPATTAAPALPSQDAGAALGLPPLTPANSPAATYAPVTLAVAPAQRSTWPLIVGGLVALLALVGGFLLWRRRRDDAAEPVVDFTPPIVAARPPEPVAIPEPVAAPPPRGIGLAVEVTRMSASLIATTLSYKLTLTNHTDTALSAVAIEGDMIAAQAQVPQERQVAVPTQPLEARFQIAELAPGASAEFAGDIRVPLSTIVPIRAGAQAWFIPLARFRVEAGRNGSGRMAVTRTWVVGEEPEVPGAALKPFRLDLGPRTYSRLGQRAID